MDTNENRSEINYKPEFNLLTDAYLGTKDNLAAKLNFLARMAQSEKMELQ